MTGDCDGCGQGLASPSNADLIRRLRRIEGQVRGLQRMLEEGRACPEILNQLAALREALNKVGVGLIARHMESCFREEDGLGASPERSRSERLEEAVQMFLKFS
ncbi:MAG: transcriptional regulator [Bacillota bacterium]|nr:MAG: transcriptional regulator [Bacillota bacterium]